MRIVDTLLLTLLIAFGAEAQPLIKESSGLAAGSDGLIWTHSDGPNIGEKSQDRNLYALSADGSVARVAKLNVRNADWEDMASFVLDGKRYLLVADVGDNLERRKENQLYVAEEPTGDSAPLAWKIRFKYPDKPHDCEAVAVDLEGQRVLLLTKRDLTPQIFAVPLTGSLSVQTAQHVGALLPLPKVSAWAVLVHPLLAPFAHQPTGMDISADGRKAVILTYAGAYLWHRQARESWPEALGRVHDKTVALPGLRQYEGVAFAPDGQAIRVSEEGNDKLHTLELPKDW